MMRKTVQTSLVCILFIGIALAFAGPRFDMFNVGKNGSYPLLTWRMASEDGVTGFKVERSTDGIQFFVIATFDHPEGAGHVYRHTDTNVFKQSTKTFHYRIRVEMLGGDFIRSETRSIQVSQTTVQQTWGSLKALFLN